MLEDNLHRQAIGLMSEAVEAGKASPEVHALLARAILQSQHGTSPTKEAIKHYEVAASLGFANAMFELGVLHAAGEAAESTPELAFEWYERAAVHGHREASLRYAEACIANGRVSGSSGINALDRLEDLTEQVGWPEANYLLGLAYEHGTIIEKSVPTAETHYRTSMVEIPNAKTRLAAIYLKRGRPAELDEARSLLTSAYEAGDVEAGAYLGHISEYGVGVKRDLDQAARLYRAAAGNGVEWAGQAAARLELRETSISMFDMRIHGAQRAELRERLEDLGVEPIRHHGPIYMDAWEAEQLVDGADTLTVAYAPGAGNHIAEIAYGFSKSSMRRAKLSRRNIIGRLIERYGEPVRVRDKQSRGIYQWQLDDLRIRLRNNSNDQSVSVVYHFEPYAERLRQLIRLSKNPGRTNASLTGDNL